jgi:hypothetical protein
MVKRTLPALFLAVSLLAPAVQVTADSPSPSRAHEIVAEQSAKNRARAEHVAKSQLRSIGLPSGAVASRGRPTGVGKLLQEPAAIPGGSRYVATHGFWTVPRSPRDVLAWLRHHTPSDTTVVGELRGSSGQTLEFESLPGPKASGDLGGLLFLTVVRRATGGSAIRADVFQVWELPRSPLERIPAGSRFLRLSVSPGSGGLHSEGEETQPPRFASTEDRTLIAKLVRVVNRQPAYQKVDLPSCGPPGLGSEYHLIALVFKASRHGRVLGRVTQETPIGICDSLQLQVGARKPYALEGGWNVLRAARGLIRRAHPRAGS